MHGLDAGSFWVNRPQGLLWKSVARKSESVRGSAGSPAPFLARGLWVWRLEGKCYVLPRFELVSPVPPALCDGANGDLGDLRFTFTDPPKRAGYNSKSLNLRIKLSFGISASEHNLCHLPGLVVWRDRSAVYHSKVAGFSNHTFRTTPWKKNSFQISETRFISQKVSVKSFCESQFPHKSANLSFIITNIRN